MGQVSIHLANAEYELITAVKTVNMPGAGNQIICNRRAARRMRYLRSPTGSRSLSLRSSRVASNAVSVQSIRLAGKGCELVEIEGAPAPVAALRAVGVAAETGALDLLGGPRGSSQTVVPLFHPGEHDAFVVGEMGPLVHSPPSGEALLSAVSTDERTLPRAIHTVDRGFRVPANLDPTPSCPPRTLRVGFDHNHRRTRAQ